MKGSENPGILRIKQGCNRNTLMKYVTYGKYGLSHQESVEIGLDNVKIMYRRKGGS